MLNQTRRRRRRRMRVTVRKKHHCFRKRRRRKAWNWTRPLLPSQYQLLMSHRSRENEADPQRTPRSLQHPASQSGWQPRRQLLVRTLSGFIRQDKDLVLGWGGPMVDANSSTVKTHPLELKNNSVFGVVVVQDLILGHISILVALRGPVVSARL